MPVTAVEPDGEAMGGLPFKSNARGIRDHETESSIVLRVRRGCGPQGRTCRHDDKTDRFHGKHFAIPQSGDGWPGMFVVRADAYRGGHHPRPPPNRAISPSTMIANSTA